MNYQVRKRSTNDDDVNGRLLATATATSMTIVNEWMNIYMQNVQLLQMAKHKRESIGVRARAFTRS